MKNIYIPQGSSEEKLKKKIDEIKTFGLEKFFVLADFDKTFTSPNSFTSWSLLSRSGLIEENYKTDRDKLYEIYRPYEISSSIPFQERLDKVREWWIGHLNLLLKYKVNKSHIDQVVDTYMSFRQGARDFIKQLNEYGIPLVFVSAGIGNFIERALVQEGAYLENVSVEANFLKFDDSGNVCGIDKEYIIHSLNKNHHILRPETIELIGNRQYAFVMGDSIDDLKIKELVTLKEYIGIGLLSSDTQPSYFDNSGFDLVSTDNSFDKITELFSSLC